MAKISYVALFPFPWICEQGETIELGWGVDEEEGGFVRKNKSWRMEGMDGEDHLAVVGR
jgi:hypothetical protein